MQGKIFLVSSASLMNSVAVMPYIDYAIVFGLGVTGMWKALPVGFILKVHPLAIGVLTLAGAIIDVFIMYHFGLTIEKLILRFTSEEKVKKKENQGRELLKKYGCPGLGLIGTLLFGQPGVMLLGMVVAQDKSRFARWVVAGTLLWVPVLTVLGTVSIELFMKIAG